MGGSVKPLLNEIVGAAMQVLESFDLVLACT